MKNFKKSALELIKETSVNLPSDVRSKLSLGIEQENPNSNAGIAMSTISLNIDMAVDNTDLAKAINDAVLETDPEMIIIVLAGSPWADLARNMGLKVAEEAFADRAVNADGTLVPRSKPGSVIHDLVEVVERSVQMITEGKVKAITGEDVNIRADTLCLHGDTPGAIEMAKAVRSGLESARVNITNLSEII